MSGDWINRWKARGVWTPNDELAIERGCWFDPKQAEHFRDFCQKNLSLWEGKQWAGKPFVLMDWQWVDVFSKLFGWFKWNPDWKCVERRFSHAFVLVPKKQGKALALDTLITTPTGWTTMGDIAVGDEVFDERGLPCTVTAATPVMFGEPCYEVEFSDGEIIRADAAHQWYTETYRTGRPCRAALRGVPSDQWVATYEDHIKTTDEIADTLMFNCGSGPACNHRIPVAGPLQTPDAILPIDPYKLGLWLGDGESTAARITVGDRDADELFRILSPMGCTPHQCSSGYRFTLPGLHVSLREAGLFSNKHIPREYLRASAAQRVALLQGLCDSDGTCAHGGQIEFTSTLPRLAGGVTELLRTLGIKPLVREGIATLYGREIGPKWRVRFYAYDDEPVFRLSRKRERQKPRPTKPTRARNRQIVRCEPIKSVPVRCIEVDSPSRLYLAGESMIPTHNSPMAAAVGGYFLAADGEQGGLVLSAASAREQAAIVHGHALNMIQASESLDPRCKLNRSNNQVTFEHPDLFKHARNMERTPANNVYKSISSDAGPQEGRNANCIIADELHVWHGRKLWDTLEYACETRVSPLFFMISTAGDDEQSVCFEQYEYAKDVMSGHVRDIGFLPYIREADKEDDFDDPETWRKANPSFGVTITETRFRGMWEKAKRTSNAAVASFKRYRFNIWGTVADPMIDPDAWDDCYEAYTTESLFGQRCHGGLDLSKSLDMTAFNLMFPSDEGMRQLCWFWLAEEQFERNKGRVPYQDWVDAGWLDICPEQTIDYDMVIERIIWAAEQYQLTSVRFDPWKGEVVVPRLTTAGIDAVEFPQQPKPFAGPTSEYEAMVLKRTLHHNGNDCLTWQSRHVKCKTDTNNNIRPVKGSRGDIRTIDGIVAGIMALDGTMREPVVGKSFYAENELEVTGG